MSTDKNGLCCIIFESWQLGYWRTILSGKESQHHPISVMYSVGVQQNARWLAFYTLKGKAFFFVWGGGDVIS